MINTNIKGIALKDLLKHAVKLRLKQPIEETGTVFKITIDDYISIIITIVPLNDSTNKRRFSAHANLVVGTIVNAKNLKLGKFK